MNIYKWLIVLALGLAIGFAMGYIFAWNNMLNVILNSNVQIDINGTSVYIDYLAKLVNGV